MSQSNCSGCLLNRICAVFQGFGNYMVPLKVNQKGLFTVELSGVLHAISANSVNHVCAKQCEVVTTAISDEQLGVGKTEQSTAALHFSGRSCESAADVAQRPCPDCRFDSNALNLSDKSHGVDAGGLLCVAQQPGALSGRRVATARGSVWPSRVRPGR